MIWTHKTIHYYQGLLEHESVHHWAISSKSSAETVVPLLFSSLYPNVNDAISATSVVGITWLHVNRTNRFLFEIWPMKPVPPTGLSSSLH